MKQLFMITTITLAISLTNCVAKKTTNQIVDINNNWKLIELKGFNGEFISPKGAPVLQINLAENRYNGNSGCNSYSGKCSVAKGGIKFMPALATKMFCEDGGLEIAFFDTLHKVTSYRIEDNKLVLISNSEDVAIFILNDVK